MKTLEELGNSIERSRLRFEAQRQILNAFKDETLLAELGYTRYIALIADYDEGKVYKYIGATVEEISEQLNKQKIKWEKYPHYYAAVVESKSWPLTVIFKSLLTLGEIRKRHHAEATQ